MRTENLFKFVAIRGPEPRRDSTSPLPGPPDDTFTAGIRTTVNSGVDLNEARRRRAGEFMDSSAYVMRNPGWKPFLVIEAWVRRLLAEISPHEDLRAAIERLLATPLGHETSLDSFANGDQFKQLKQTLWDSYYCAVILPERRPQDRPRLLFWIRFWRLMERLANGEQAPALLAELDRWQPSVPHVLVRAMPRPATQMPKAPPRFAARRARIGEQTTVLNGLKAAQSWISQLIRESLRTTAPQEESTIRLGSLPSRPTTSALRIEGGMDDDELLLRPDQLDPAVRATLEQHGLSLADDATELLARLTDLIAQTHHRIGELRRVEQLTVTGGALVMRRRNLTDAELEGREEE